MGVAEVLASCEDMTISREEFLRCLPAAVGHEPFDLDGDTIRHGGVGRGWRVEIAPLPELRLGLLALPRLRVRIHLAGYPEAESRRFLERWALHFRRGGG